jgi:nucleoside-diphosphate-sugar epimerase
VFNGTSLCNGDESLPYAEKYLCHYAHTKALAEQDVLKFSKETAAQVLILRPHLIWGPEDPHFLPRILEKRRHGKLFRIGNQKNHVDVIYVDNAAHAHVCALNAMVTNPNLTGRAYFLGQEASVNLWDFVDQLLIASKLDPLPAFAIPSSLAYAIGYLSEKLYSLLGIYDREPSMTRFVAQQVSLSHYFSHQQALRDLAYTPQISISEGLKQIKPDVTQPTWQHQ